MTRPNRAELVEVVPESKKNGPWNDRTKLEKVLLVVSGVAVVSCVMAVAIVANQGSTGPEQGSSNGLTMYQTTFNGERDICTSSECVIAAADIIQSMDTTVSPCSNFYKFACGGWQAKHPVPEESSRWGQFDLLRRELSNAISQILDEQVNASDPLPFNQAKHIYKACMNTDLLEEIGLEPLTEFLDHFGGWPMSAASWSDEDYDFLSNVASIRKETVSSLIIYTWVFADERNTDETAIYLDQTSLGMPRSVLVNPGEYSSRIEAYKMYMKTTASLIIQGNNEVVDDAILDKDIDDTLAFEMKLANLTSPSEDRRDINRMYNKMTIEELNSLTEGNINWLNFLQNTFALANVSTLEVTTPVIVQEVEYLKNLSMLIKETDSRVLANYLGWRHVMAFGDETTHAMREAKFQYSMIANGVTAESPRWKQCSDKANNDMGMAIGTEYVKRYFSEQAKDEANAMVEDIRTSFEDLLDENVWMDSETKPFAKEKAEAISKFIAYPDWYSTEGALENYYSLLNGINNDTHFNNIIALSKFWTNDELSDYGRPSNRDKWLSPPTIVNAFYLPEFNSITFPAGILQPPFYRANTIQAINYGGIGQVIGHEITHGFDDQGRQNDKHGNAIPWWTNATLEAFKEKAQCIVDQYSNFRVPEIDDLHPNATLNGINTQGENIADNGGLREALLAYQKFVERHGEEPRLPGLENYTPYQILFLSNANIWCENISKEGLLNQILTDPHSPAQFRVKGPMSNMKEFSDIWGCTSDDLMNPQDKCVVW